MKRRDEGDVGILAQRVAKRESPMGRQLGHQPVGDRLDTIVFLGLIRRRLRACGHARIVMLGSRRDRRRVGRTGLGVVLRGDRKFVFGADIAALDAQGAGTVDADEGASSRDLLGIEGLWAIIEGGKRRLDLAEPLIGLVGQFLGFGVGLLQTVHLGLQRIARRLLIAGERNLLAAQLPQARGKVIVLVHGLCMNDRQWTRQGHDHGQALAAALGATALYLHYNSGRHVSQNGREFAALLEQALQAWPVPVTEIVIVGHSMGGLLARSACHVAAAAGHDWPSKLRALVFLGTPHQGAPLERGGHLVDMLFGISPYVAPFARLGKARSAGITDLRFGNLRDADWQGRDRHAQKRDDRVPTPLPEGVDAYLVAATTAKRAGSLRSTLVGDGLVPLGSALGAHRNPRLALSAVPDSHRLVITEANHWDLLNSAQVIAQLKAWLA